MTLERRIVGDSLLLDHVQPFASVMEQERERRERVLGDIGSTPVVAPCGPPGDQAA